MHLKVDEDLPPIIARFLVDRGYSCSTVVDQRMGGYKDPDLWLAVQEHGQFLITGDKGFGDIRAYPPGSHHGILLLRPDQDGIRPLIELMEQILASINDLRGLSGLLAVASPQGLQIRRPDT
jgi:predicted nuclease of predicted toxin-antitoxin system